MSKVSLGTLLAAVALVVLAVVFDVPFMRGGSGVILLVGLIYAYTVAQREVELLQYAVNHHDDEDADEDVLVLVEQA